MVQAHSASRTRYKVSVTCVVSVRKVREKRSAAENDATVGIAVTNSGRAFHAWVAASGNERSPSVARRVTALTMKMTAGVDVT